MQKCIELDEKLKEMDREITVNPQYVQKVDRHSKLAKRICGGEAPLWVELWS